MLSDFHRGSFMLIQQYDVLFPATTQKSLCWICAGDVYLSESSYLFMCRSRPPQHAAQGVQSHFGQRWHQGMV